MDKDRRRAAFLPSSPTARGGLVMKLGGRALQMMWSGDEEEEEEEEEED